MSDVKTAVCQAYYSGKTVAETLTFRTQLFDAFDAANITGRFVLNEGDFWIDIEGDPSDIDSATHDMGQDPFFDSFAIESETTSRSRRFNKLYAYYDAQTPLST